jgi:hypothetical protein
VLIPRRPRFGHNPVEASCAVVVGVLAGARDHDRAAGGRDRSRVGRTVGVVRNRVINHRCAGRSSGEQLHGRWRALYHAVRTDDGEAAHPPIHGVTRHAYWDVGGAQRSVQPYARDLGVVGPPTFTINEIAASQSSHPPTGDVTVAGYFVHAIVQDLPDGVVGGVKFGHVTEVAHAFGSFATWVEAAIYHDVAEAIITGAAHDLTAS